MKRIIKEHKALAIIIVLCLVLVVLMGIIFLSLILSKDKNQYGSRLEGIKDVEISKDTYKEIEEKIKENEYVDSVKTRLQGKIVYIDVVFKQGINGEDAKGLVNGTIECFSEDELNYYDIEYVLSQLKPEEETEESSVFNIMGTKHPNNDSISWIKS